MNYGRLSPLRGLNVLMHICLWVDLHFQVWKWHNSQICGCLWTVEPMGFFTYKLILLTSVTQLRLYLWHKSYIHLWNGTADSQKHPAVPHTCTLLSQMDSLAYTSLYFYASTSLFVGWKFCGKVCFDSGENAHCRQHIFSSSAQLKTFKLQSISTVSTVGTD